MHRGLLDISMADCKVLDNNDPKMIFSIVKPTSPTKSSKETFYREIKITEQSGENETSGVESMKES